PITTGYNRDKFKWPNHEVWHRELFKRNIWYKRTFKNDLEGEFKACLKTIEEMKWQKMVTPPTNLNYEIMWELYVNVMPSGDQPFSFMIMVRGRDISFSMDAINAYLGDPLTFLE
ncbi:hypothetical protein RYX36_017586, partial [Vicia faba]